MDIDGLLSRVRELPGGAWVLRAGSKGLQRCRSTARALRENPPSWWQILALGLFVRFLLAPYSMQADLLVDGRATLTMVYGGGPYTYPIIYPPGFSYLLNAEGRALAFLYAPSTFLAPNSVLLTRHAWLGFIQPSYVPGPGYAIAEKAPLFLFDLLTGILLSVIVKERGASEETSRLVFALWFLNPLTIVESSLHGAFDTIPTFFLLATLYLLLHDRSLMAGVALALGTALKIFPAVFIPLLLAFVVLRYRASIKRLGFHLGSAAAGLAATLLVLFLPADLLVVYLGQFTYLASSGSAFGGFGIWSPLSLPYAVSLSPWLRAHNGPVSIVLDVAAVLILLLGTWAYVRRQSENDLFGKAGLLAMVSTVFAAFVLQPYVQPQYMVWLLPFVLLLGVLHGAAKPLFWAISTLPPIYLVSVLGGPGYYFEPLPILTSFGSLPAQLASANWFYSWSFPVLAPLTFIPVSVLLVHLTWKGLPRWSELRRRPA